MKVSHLFHKDKALQLKETKSESVVTQSCPTLCNPMDSSLPGSPIHGISKAEY